MDESNNKPSTAEELRKDILTPEELAAVLGCGRTTAYALLRNSEIPSFTVGRLRRVRRADVDAYIRRRLQSRE